MNITTSNRNMFRRALVASGVAIAIGGMVAPMGASADTIGGCPSTRIWASHDGQVLHGTCGNDLIKIGKYKNVTVHAHGGNDDVRAGWADSGLTEVHLGSGNDVLANGGYQQVLAYGDGGADTLEGGNRADTLNGGSGNDKLVAWGGGPFDYVIGSTGTDTAYVDGNDVVFGVETVID